MFHQKRVCVSISQRQYMYTYDLVISQGQYMYDLVIDIHACLILPKICFLLYTFSLLGRYSFGALFSSIPKWCERTWWKITECKSSLCLMKAETLIMALLKKLWFDKTKKKYRSLLSYFQLVSIRLTCL